MKCNYDKHLFVRLLRSSTRRNAKFHFDLLLQIASLVWPEEKETERQRERGVQGYIDLCVRVCVCVWAAISGH